MALIKCPECGKEISDKSTNCIHCGCPIDKNLVKDNFVNTKFYKVILFSYTEKISTIKIIMDVLGLSLSEAKEYLDNIPVLLVDGLSKEKAEEIGNSLSAVGANIKVVWSNEIMSYSEKNNEQSKTSNNNEKRILIYNVQCGYDSLGVWYTHPDSAGGVGVRFSFTNLGKKAIKYATLYFTPYNNVGDKVCCTITGKCCRSARLTGIIGVGETKYNQMVNNIWYNASITKVKVDFVELEYTDGTIEKVTTSQMDIKYANQQGCYIATSVYGSYDCPQVWVLRRYRDYVLAKTWYGRLFISLYYMISPTVVKYCGNMKVFKKFWMKELDKVIDRLQSKGFEASPYNDKLY